MSHSYVPQIFMAHNGNMKRGPYCWGPVFSSSIFKGLGLMFVQRILNWGVKDPGNMDALQFVSIFFTLSLRVSPLQRSDSHFENLSDFDKASSRPLHLSCHVYSFKNSPKRQQQTACLSVIS